MRCIGAGPVAVVFSLILPDLTDCRTHLGRHPVEGQATPPEVRHGSGVSSGEDRGLDNKILYTLPNVQ